MPAPQMIMEEALRVGESGHARWQLKAVHDATENGAIAWVSVGFLMSIADAGGVLPRRQDLPRDAFLTVEEVKDQALFHVCNRWLSRDHPDPEGFHLKQLVDVLKKEKGHPRDGVFWDWSNLFQNPRTGHEQAKYTEGLRMLDWHVCSSIRDGALCCPMYPKVSQASHFGKVDGAITASSCRHSANALSQRRNRPLAHTWFLSSSWLEGTSPRFDGFFEEQVRRRKG